MSWDSEFGDAYKVPKKILDLVEAGVLQDSSWHNDIAPSFERELEGGFVVRLWSEHPKPAEREAGGSRFWISLYHDGASLFEIVYTDRLEDALLVLKTMLESAGVPWPG